MMQVCRVTRVTSLSVLAAQLTALDALLTVFDQRLVFVLPLHVTHRISTTSTKRVDVVNYIARTTTAPLLGRWARVVSFKFVDS